MQNQSYSYNSMRLALLYVTHAKFWSLPKNPDFLVCFDMQICLARNWIETKIPRYTTPPHPSPIHYWEHCNASCQPLLLALSKEAKVSLISQRLMKSRSQLGLCLILPMKALPCSGKRTQSNRFPLLDTKEDNFFSTLHSKVNHLHIVDAKLR